MKNLKFERCKKIAMRTTATIETMLSIFEGDYNLFVKIEKGDTTISEIMKTPKPTGKFCNDIELLEGERIVEVKCMDRNGEIRIMHENDNRECEQPEEMATGGHVFGNPSEIVGMNTPSPYVLPEKKDPEKIPFTLESFPQDVVWIRSKNYIEGEKNAIRNIYIGCIEFVETKEFFNDPLCMETYEIAPPCKEGEELQWRPFYDTKQSIG